VLAANQSESSKVGSAECSPSGLSRCAIATFNEGEISELNAVGQGHPETNDRVSG
jgi:hypothetical protein